MNNSATCAAALVALACVGLARAHHSISMFDIGKPIWVKGTVVSFERINPHVMFALEQKGDDGQVRRWTVEGPGLNSFTRAGLGADFLQVGDVIEVCGFAVKEEIAARNSGGDARGSARPSIHGNVLVMPDGQMRLFGGYGKLENCIRPDDQIPAWVNFVNTDSRARNAWCNSRVFANFPSLPPRAFVDEINRLIANPCPPLAQR
jgi:hypothetical protein